MKNCKECNIEFEPVKTKGSEQLYCTKTCQSKAAYKRSLERIKNRMYEEAKKEARIPVGGNREHPEQHPWSSQGLGGIQGRDNRTTDDRRFTSNNPGKDYLELYYEAKINNNLYQLKNENLERRVQELEKTIFDLNSELDQLDQEQEGGMLGSLMEQFKKDPVNSVNFVSTVIDNLTKPKK